MQFHFVSVPATPASGVDVRQSTMDGEHAVIMISPCCVVLKKALQGLSGGMGLKALVMVLAFGAFAAPLRAQEANKPWEEYEKLTKDRGNVGVMGSDLLGDQVNFYTGGLSFSNLDISVPGNSSLPVSLGRSFSVGNRKGYSRNDLLMADWDLDVPRMVGRPAKCSATAPHEARPASIKIGVTYFEAVEFWHGVQLEIPSGGGEMLLANASTPKPTTGGPYYWVSGQTLVSCLPSLKNDANSEGFLAVTSSGTKYWFDIAAAFDEPGYEKSIMSYGSTVLHRSRSVIYASRVEDRFGNWVTYSYSNASNERGRLVRIDSSDGRQITLAYNGSGFVEAASDGSQTWQYLYSYSTPKVTLSAVVLPDGNRWTIDFGAFSNTSIRYLHGEPGVAWRNCTNPGDIANEVDYVGTITHPSGAVGQFTVAAKRFGRTNVPQLCGGYVQSGNVTSEYSIYPLVWDSFALTRKHLSGPGLVGMEWNYEYSSGYTFAPGTAVCTGNGACSPVCLSDDCAGKLIATVVGPNNELTRYTFGNSYRYNEGKLLKTERGASAAQIMRTETTAYELAQSGQPYPMPLGADPQPHGGGFSAEYVRPVISTVINQDATTFTSEVPTCGSTRCFDVYARPTMVNKRSSLGNPGKTDATAYHDDTARWVLGQLRSVTNVDTGEVISLADYDSAQVLPIRVYSFGELQQTLTYNGDGTVATAADGAGNTTTLSNWMRGIPQTIRHPATPESPSGATEAAVVDNQGLITSSTDENGFSTSYQYDAMGRLNRIVYPVGDAPASNDKVFSFVKVDAEEMGIPAGHWRQTITQGNYLKSTFFDALWRPVVEHEHDVTNTNQTYSIKLNGFDHEGRQTFASYPRNPLQEGQWGPWTGVRTQYDALGRVTRSEQDSELGVLVTTTEYLPGFQRRITNPRGFQATQQFQVFDTPSYDGLIKADAPQGVSTVIVRDRYGAPLEVTRTGPDS
ncbi:hypothetical protein ASD53_04850 [Lysobacter sp. Root559]|uniref:RHS repeat protein n=1 Tax=Lysobacter sp. Root559 TaxID=1736559 RepID=UPI0006FB7F11|nr:RHS repeat protein [Lysobacter sp. Root559]KQZ59543.1 hypothetical protein ASD53_04850 [Lysobacter sp. Root559]